MTAVTLYELCRVPSLNSEATLPTSQFLHFLISTIQKKKSTEKSLQAANCHLCVRFTVHSDDAFL